jgi:peptidyl-dipeptidase Dcp
LICPEYRGLGLGGKLMTLFMDFLKSSGFKSAYLWTTNELHKAASLYQRHGFVLVEERPSQVFGKPLHEQKYEFTF